MRILLEHKPPLGFPTSNTMSSRDVARIARFRLMGPDADHGESTADAGQSVGQEEQGHVLPNEQREPAVSCQGDLQWLVVTEVGRRPSVRGDEVVQQATCRRFEGAVTLWAVAWSMCARTLMLLFLLVADELITTVCLVRAWHFHGVDELLELDAAGIASAFAAESAECTQPQNVPNLTELFRALRTQNVPSRTLKKHKKISITISSKKKKG